MELYIFPFEFFVQSNVDNTGIKGDVKVFQQQITFHQRDSIEELLVCEAALDLLS